MAFEKLKNFALNARHFWWWSSWGSSEYRGPINPTGILLATPKTKTKYWLVLCEHVPYSHLLDVWDEESPEGVVVAGLNDTLEFMFWDAEKKELGGINAWCGPGTKEEQCHRSSRWRTLYATLRL